MFDSAISSSYDSGRQFQMELDRHGREVAPLGAFGERLRRERELRGISLDQIVATTKIGRRLLTAIEDEQFDLLPGGIFNKSYVRAYAKCVGIDEDEAVAEYLQAAGEVPPDTRVIAHQHASIHSDRQATSSGFPLLPVFILMVVIAGGLGGWKVYQDHLRERESPASANPSASLTPSPSTAAAPSGDGVATSGSTVPLPATASSSTVTMSFEVTILPKDPAWVSIKADGADVVRGIIRPPEPKTIHAMREIVFYTSNSGAVEVSFNGKRVPPSAGRGQEESLVFDARGLRPKSSAP